MRILMFDNEFPPLGGGTGVVNLCLLQEFAKKQDLSIDLITSSRLRSTYEEEQFAPRIRIFKVPVWNKNIHHASNTELLKYTFRGLSKAQQLIKYETYDATFAFAGVPAGVMAWIIKLAYKIPYLVSLQGPDVPGFEARYNWLYPVLRPLLRIVWKRSIAVTAISQQHKALALETAPRQKIHIVYNGIDGDNFKPVAIDNQRLCEDIRILCVGRLIERKGQQHLLRAFQVLLSASPRLSLVLAGTGDNELALKDIAAKLGIMGRVEFRGFVPREDIADIYTSSHIFVLPSESEGMSIALLEAMASGLPVIVTDTGGSDELVKQSGAGIVVDWADTDGLAHALGTLVSDPEMRRAMGAAARLKALHYSWSAIAAEYLSLFNLPN